MKPQHALARCLTLLALCAAPQVLAHDDAARLRLLAEGNARLAAGDAAAAERAFDGAAAMQHAADAEIGLVRAYMQAGDYRRALGFAAHSAAAHHDEPATSALYAWLLQLGGQGDAAARLLQQALATTPADPMLRQVQALQAAAASGNASDALPAALRPVAGPAPADAAARAVGSAVLAGDGRLALVPARLVDGARGLWLRNGLGHTAEARVERLDADTGVAVLRLQSPLRWPAGLQLSPREPFGGSPGLMVEYVPGPTAQAAWPQLRQGFFGRVPAAAGSARPLGIDAPPGPRGGPVFDAAGRLAGLAGTAPDGSATLLPARLLASLGGLQPAAAAAPAAVASAEAVYETGLLVALQVLVSR